MNKNLLFLFFVFLLSSCSFLSQAEDDHQLPGLHIDVKADGALLIEGKPGGTAESSELRTFLNDLPEMQKDTLSVFLHIDRNTRMKNVIALRNTLRECGIRKINYVSQREKP